VTGFHFLVDGFPTPEYQSPVTNPQPPTTSNRKDTMKRNHTARRDVSDGKAMRRRIALALGFAALTMLAGCSASTKGSDTEQKQMTDNFHKKGFDINDVPPAQRERVRAMMEQSRRPASSSPGR
jgi:hypothetical protein